LFKKGIRWHDAEEISAAALFTALNSIDNFAGKSSFKTWLFRILHNRAADHFKPKGRNPYAWIPGLSPESRQATSLEEYPAAADAYRHAPGLSLVPYDSPYRRLGESGSEYEERRDSIQNSIDHGEVKRRWWLTPQDRDDYRAALLEHFYRLSFEHRAIIVYRKLERLSLEKTGQLVGKKAKTVSAACQHGLLALRRSLDKDRRFRPILARVTSDATAAQKKLIARLTEQWPRQFNHYAHQLRQTVRDFETGDAVGRAYGTHQRVLLGPRRSRPNRQRIFG
jgi:RNA polymerase sigma factor (sigma-70 family)